MGKFFKILFFVNFVVISIADQKISEEKISALKKFAEKFRKTLNFDTNPCVDYFDYTCKNFNEIETTREKFTQLNDDEIKDIIDKFIINKSNKIDAEIKMENYLKACQDLKGKQDMKEFLKNWKFMSSKGNWPIFDSTWKPDEFDSLKAMEKLYTYGIQTFFSTYSPLEVFTINTKESGFSDKMTKQIAEQMTKIFREIGFENAEEIIEDYKKFNSAMKTAIDEAKKDPETNKIQNSYKDFKEQFNEINWDNILKMSGNKIDENTIVAVENPNALRQIITVIKNTDRKIFANYVLLQMIPLLYQIRDLKETCYQQVYMNFKPILTRAIINNYYSEDYKKQVLDIFGWIVKDSKEMQVDQLKKDIDTRVMQSIKEENLNKEYAEIETDSNNYYKNVLEMLTYNYKPNTGRIFYVHDYNMKPLSGSVLSDIFTDILYKQRNIPSSLLYKKLAYLIESDLMRSNTNEETTSNESDEDCIRSFSDISIKEIPFVIIQEQIIKIKIYNDWEKTNQNQIQQEDEILKEFGLSNRKIFYEIISQTRCKLQPEEIAGGKIAGEIYKFMKEFSNEYSCPEDAPMNLVSKCMI